MTERNERTFSMWTWLLSGAIAGMGIGAYFESYLGIYAGWIFWFGIILMILFTFMIYR